MQRALERIVDAIEREDAEALVTLFQQAHSLSRDLPQRVRLALALDVCCCLRCY